MRLTATNSLAASLAGLGLAGLLAGCASSGSTAPAGAQAPATSSAAAGGQPSTVTPSAGPTSAGGTSPGSSTTPGASSPGSTVPRATPAGQGGSGGLAVLPCPTSGLKVARGTAGAAAGSVYVEIDFTNTSGRTCTLDGYPGVALTASESAGSQVGAAASRASTKPAVVVTLTAGATASATLQVTEAANYPAASCEPKAARYLQVYPPGQKDPVYVPYTSQGCVKPVFVLGVTTVAAGAGNS
jgi:hypothetical protein